MPSARERQDPAQHSWPSQITLRVIAASIFLALFIQFYWTTLRSKFNLLSGDEGDALLVAHIHEHVYQSLLGHASLRNPSFFFPAQGVLGYTDAFLLNQIFYAPLRALGVEQLLAVQLTWMALTVMGGVAFALLLTRIFRVRAWLAILAAGLFAFGHGLFMKMLHSQHLSIHFLPIVGLLALSAVLRDWSASRTAASALAAGLLLGLAFTTGFYMPWFFSFFLLFAVPTFVVRHWRSVIEFVRDNRQRLITAALAGVVGFGLGAALLLSIYWQAIETLRVLSVNQYLATAATFRDIINVSDGNLLWGPLLRDTQIIPLDRLRMTELHLAVTPLLVLTTVFSSALLLRDRKFSEYGEMAAAFCVAALFGYAMLYVLTISFHGTTSLFLIVQKIVPGAIAIRTGFRSQIISAMFVTLAFAVAAEASLRRAESARSPTAFDFRSLAILLLGIVLALEQVDLNPRAFVNRERESATIADAPPPPGSCRAFAVYDDSSRMLQSIHIDAMRLSQRFGIPTLNGYSGGSPPQWDFGNVWEPQYVQKMRTWARNKGLTGPLCLYDATTKSWRDLGSAPF